MQTHPNKSLDPVSLRPQDQGNFPRVIKHPTAYRKGPLAGSMCEIMFQAALDMHVNIVENPRIYIFVVPCQDIECSWHGYKVTMDTAHELN
jgi:hypothetical protein